MKVFYQHTCIYCGHTIEQEYTVPLGEKIPMPSTPEGWNVFNNEYICNRHEIIINKLIVQEEINPYLYAEEGRNRLNDQNK